MQTRDRLYIGGMWVDPAGSERLDVISPATEEIIGRVPHGNVADIDRAVQAARDAFDDGAWPRATLAERAEALVLFADALAARTDEFAAAISSEGGFPIALVPGQVALTIDFVRYYADLISTAGHDDRRATSTGHAVVRHLPVGVVGAIVPWNIPLLGALSKIAPALAAGCTVVHKPSPETPLSAFILAEAAQAAGLPAGVLNVVPASVEGSLRLIDHSGVDQIAFTGSTAVGRHIAVACAKQLKRYSLELGGNAAAIVLDDAPLQLVATGLMMTGLVLNNGEACIAQRRVLVPRARRDEVAEALAAATTSIPVGTPDDPGTLVGPMITQAHQQRVLGYCDIGRDEGANVAAGGGRPTGLDRGWYVEPTVLVDVHNGMRVAREEVFGLVVSVIPYPTEEEAIAIASDTDYGLSSSVWTADPARGAELGKNLRVGSLYVNGALKLDPNVPFGGFKQSGVGRELGPEGLAEYQETQAVFCHSWLFRPTGNGRCENCA
jgi:aldehyde dehydrogenase (NAD+)